MAQRWDDGENDFVNVNKPNILIRFVPSIRSITLLCSLSATSSLNVISKNRVHYKMYHNFSRRILKVSLFLMSVNTRR